MAELTPKLSELLASCIVNAILEGAEPFSAQAGPQGVLVLHGFTGNPQSMRPIAVALNRANFSVELPLLPGHGTSMEDMVPKRFSDWLEAAESAYSAISAKYEDIYVVGLSMGGTLSCYLAANHPEIKGLVLVNPFVDPPAKEYREIVEGLLDQGMEIAPGVGSDIKKPGMKELAYEGSPLRGALSLFDGLDALQEKLVKIKCPILLFSSREDHVVPSSSGDVLVENVSGSCERVWLENSYHVATLDFDQELIESKAAEFLLSLSSK
ncbi:MAG: alpha/beta fold hydrolase [Acidimicrobiales bacterium]|nr:alpha/beta fold hydrolase [Acidimicrobiales bacterium]